MHPKLCWGPHNVWKRRISKLALVMFTLVQKSKPSKIVVIYELITSIGGWTVNEFQFSLFPSFLVGIALTVQVIPLVPKFCLSIVYHICAPLFNCSTDFDTICQVHLWGPMTHCVRWGSLTPTGRADEGWSPSQNMQLQIAAKPSVLCCHMVNTNE